MVRRQRVAPTQEWQQIELLVRTPEQRTYEVLRPVVLFGQPVPVRASETGLPQSTLYRQAAAFDRDGMASLFPPPMPERHQQLGPEIRQAILDAKREYPALNIHEITTICWARFGHRPSSRTVKRLLAEQPLPPRAARRYPPYRAFDDPVTARLAIVRLHLEGWNAKSIAGYLECSRDTTHRVLKRWVAEGVAGLDDRSHARQGGPRQVDLRAILAVKELQRNPELGEWRVHAALRQQGIDLSPRTCGRILALNRALYGLPKAERAAREPRPMPFQAARRHAIWTVDIRYLDAPDVAGGAYSITILDNFSRAIVASLLSPRQDLVAYLLVLYAAVRQHGAPETLVSDRGGVFLATQAQAIYRALGIAKREIARRQPWQSYIETMFNVQRRMADWDFARAATWAALADEHARWVGNYNQQDHWAHRQRPPDRRSPAAVLGWVGGRQFTPRGVASYLPSHSFRPDPGSARLSALPQLAPLRGTGLGRRAGGGLAVRADAHHRLRRRGTRAVPRHLPARPTTSRHGGAAPALRDAAPRAATIPLGAGRWRLAPGAPATHLRRARASGADRPPGTALPARWDPYRGGMMRTTTLPIRGYRDETVPNRFHRQDAETDHLALVLPGFGYSCDMPLLYFAVSHLLNQGADVLQVEYDYSRRADYRTHDADERLRWLLADVTAAWRVILSQRSYQRFTLIGLSLGTRALPALLANEPRLRDARTIWFSPPWHEDAVGAHLRRGAHPALVVIGTADPAYDEALVASLRAGDGCEVLVVPDADHGGLEVPGDVVHSVQAVERAIRAVQRFTT